MIRALIVFGLSTTIAQAQTLPLKQPPDIRAITARLIREINTGLQCETALGDLQDKMAAAQDELKKLRDEAQTNAPQK